MGFFSKVQGTTFLGSGVAVATAPAVPVADCPAAGVAEVSVDAGWPLPPHPAARMPRANRTIIAATFFNFQATP